jgi:hypothetical protein
LSHFNQSFRRKSKHLSAGAASSDAGASGANVKVHKRCTARQSRTRIVEQTLPSQYIGGELAMMVAKLFLYFYVAQAAVGATIGFALPFFLMIAD